jgi:hypothetical protein
MAAEIKVFNRKVRKEIPQRKPGVKLGRAGGETAAFQQRHITPSPVHAS